MVAGPGGQKLPSTYGIQWHMYYLTTALKGILKHSFLVYAVPMCMPVYMCAWCLWSQENCVRTLELELQTVVNRLPLIGQKMKGKYLLMAKE